VPGPRGRVSLPRLMAMERSALERHLLQVNADLAQGNEHLVRQRRIVSDLEQSGADARTAKEVLQELEATQAIYAAEAARLTKELQAAAN